MHVFDGIGLALRAINQTRPFFGANVIAVSMGVFLMVTMLAIGMGIRDYINVQLNKDSSSLAINVMRPSDPGETPPLNQMELEAIKNLSGVKMAFPYYRAFGDMSYAGREVKVSMMSFNDDQDPELADLEYVGDKKIMTDETAFPVVIPVVITRQLGAADPVDLLGKNVVITFTRRYGERVEQQTVNARVAAIAKKTRLGRCFLPLEKMYEVHEWLDWREKTTLDAGTPYSAVFVYTKSLQDIESVQASLEKKGYKTSSIAGVIKRYKEIGWLTTIVLGCLGLVTLLAGSISIFNTTYASVIRRTREIGVYRAIGATSGDVLFLFLAEAMVTGCVAGLLGFIVGSLFLLTVNEMFLNKDTLPALRVDWVLFSFAFTLSLLTCLMASLWPAYRAARANPVESLRNA